MAAQKHTKKFRQKFFAFLNAYYPKAQLIKALNSLDSSRTYGRLLENPKTGGSRELFLPENDFKTCSAVKFSKKHTDFGGLETNNEDMKFKLAIFLHALHSHDLHMNSI